MVRRRDQLRRKSYDGHTLAAQIKQGENLIGGKVSEVHVNMGYRGHDYEGAVRVHVEQWRRGRTPPMLWRWVKRRPAVEPSIRHLRSEHRLERNRLKGGAGSAINALLAAAAMKLPKADPSFSAHSSVMHEQRLEPAAHPATPASQLS